MEEPVSRAEFEQLQKLIAGNNALIQDNNRILHSMRKWGRIAFAAKVLLWAAVLLVPVLLYPYIAPKLSQLTFFPITTSSSTNLTGSSIFGYPSPTEIKELLHPK
jgi:hypothetical protein